MMAQPDTLLVYLSCYQALRANNDARAAGVLQTAYRQLQAQAALIPDEPTRCAFLEKAPLHFFHMDHGVGFYLQMLLAPPGIVMGIWLIVKGFNQVALKDLL